MVGPAAELIMVWPIVKRKNGADHLKNAPYGKIIKPDVVVAKKLSDGKGIEVAGLVRR